MSQTKRWLSIISLVPTVALTFMDQTILPVALPAIQKDLGATDTELQWCVNAYLLAIAIFVLISGKLSDSLGLRKALSLGMLGFVFFSALCGLGLSIQWLIWMRALQGGCAALMIPAQTALLRHIFPPEKRGRAVGLVVSIGSLFLMIAPIIGGYLTEFASWHWIFWINLPIGLVGFCLTRAFLPAPAPVKSQLDLWGFLFFALGVGFLTLFFMQANDWGWGSPLSLICIGLSLLSLLALFYREKRTAHPLLDLALFKKPIFAATNISVSIGQFILMITVFWTIYFQEILDYTPIESGLIIFVSCFPVLFIAPFAGFLSDRLGPKVPVALGNLFLIYSCFFLAFFNTPSLPSLLFTLIIFGMGIPLIFTPSFASAISSVPAQKAGVAMGTLVTLRILAGAIGLALIHLVTSSVRMAKLPTDGERLATIASFSTVHFALGFLVIVTFAVTFVLHSRKSAHHIPEFPSEGWD